MARDPLDRALADRLASIGTGAEPILIMTGAGISAESGIPTFRGEEGYWTVGSRNFHPMELATHSAFGQHQREVWRWYLYRRSICRRADPNPAHRALVELERALGDRFRLITQNVDGLHLRAGNSFGRTYQIHGNIDFMRCANRCNPSLHPVPDIEVADREAILPDEDFARLQCPACAAPTRPHVLWFDECYDETLFFFDSALQAASTCAALIVVGSSGATNLPMHVCTLVAQRGRPIIDVNTDDNVFSRHAEASPGGAALRGTASHWVPQIVEALRRC